jgi:hypothetical protein
MLSAGVVPVHEFTYGDPSAYYAASMSIPLNTLKERSKYLLTNEKLVSFYGDPAASMLV